MRIAAIAGLCLLEQEGRKIVLSAGAALCTGSTPMNLKLLRGSDRQGVPVQVWGDAARVEKEGREETRAEEWRAGRNMAKVDGEVKQSMPVRVSTTSDRLFFRYFTTF